MPEQYQVGWKGRSFIPGKFEVSDLTNQILMEEATGFNHREPTGNRSPMSGPSDLFRSRDGWFIMQVIGQKVFRRWCKVVGREDLAADPRFATNEARVERRDELRGILESRLKTRSKREWTAMFVDAGLPAGPINTLDEVFADPQVLHSQLTETLTHPILGALRQVVTPVFGATAGAASRPPPLLGEHTVEVLREAGFDAASINALLAAQVVFQDCAQSTGTAP